MDFLLKKWSEEAIKRNKTIATEESNALEQCMWHMNLIKDIEDLPYELKHKKNIVLSSGQINSPLMFIGEAPGEEENSQKKPFVGASGKLLNQMLSNIDVDRDKIYITNVFFWQPEQNRTPNSQELEMTLPIVKKHIALQKPKLIVALGSVATKALLKINEGILKLRGTLQSYEDIPVFVMPHPSYILRTQTISDYLGDFQKLKAYLELNNIYTLVKKN